MNSVARFVLHLAVVILFLSVFCSSSGIGLGSALLALAGLFYFRGEWKRWTGLPLFWPILLFVAAISLSVLFAEGTGFAKSLGKVKYFLVYFFLVFYFRAFGWMRDWLAKAAVPLSLLLLVVSLYQFRGYDPLIAHGFTWVELAKLAGSEGAYHARGLLYHHNPFAYTTLLLFHLLFAYGLSAVRGRGFYFAGAVVCLACLGLSGSRGSWVAMAVSVGVLFAVLARRRWKLFAGLGFAGLVVAGALAVPMASRFKSIAPSQNADRMHLWQVSYDMFREHPLLGTGYHYGFEQQRMKYMSEEEKRNPHFPTDPHSLYFDLLATTGLIGFLAFLNFAFSALRGYVGAIARSTVENPALVAGLGAWVAFLVGTAFDSHFFHTQTMMGTLFLLGWGQSARPVQNP
jgi:O-antigen ligase